MCAEIEDRADSDMQKRIDANIPVSCGTGSER